MERPETRMSGEIDAARDMHRIYFFRDGEALRHCCCRAILPSGRRQAAFTLNETLASNC